MEALAELEAIEGVGVDPRIAALQERWAAVRGRIEAGTLEADRLRAEVLAQAEEEQLTIREIADTIHLSFAYVVDLLRYHRFLIARAIKIQEGTFRKYWKQHSDPSFHARGKGNKAKRDAYEASVFEYIVKQIEAGIPPQKHPRTIKPVTNVDIQKKGDPLAAYRKEVAKRIKEEIDPLVSDMKQLFGCDRSSYAPNLIGAMGMKLEKIMERIVELLAPAND